MRQKTYYAAKVNIHQNILSPNLTELIEIHIPRAIESAPEINKAGWNWAFTDVKREIINSRDVIYGNITKSKHRQQLIRRKNATMKVKSDYELANTALFVYDIKSEILIHSTSSEIKRDKFIEIFELLVGQDYYVGEIKINHIPISTYIRGELLSIEKAIYIQFNLIHPNPFNEDEFNLYNKLIHDTGVTEAEVNYKNPSGFEVTKTGSEKLKDSIEDGIRLVEEGYGDVKFRGYNEIPKRSKKGKLSKTKKWKKFSSQTNVEKTKTSATGMNLVRHLTSFMMNLKE